MNQESERQRILRETEQAAINTAQAALNAAIEGRPFYSTKNTVQAHASSACARRYREHYEAVPIIITGLPDPVERKP